MNKFFTKNKNKKFIFFQKKLGQEIKNRKKPEKSGNPKNPTKNPSKNLSKMIDFHSLTPAAVLFPLGQSLILLNKLHSQALCSQC